jgi:selenocysteine-specific elongation factor
LEQPGSDGVKTRVEVGLGAFLSSVERRLRGTVAALIQAQGGVTVAQVREALGSSRKFVVPFLEYLDRIGFTKRVGDVRHLAEP